MKEGDFQRLCAVMNRIATDPVLAADFARNLDSWKSRRVRRRAQRRAWQGYHGLPMEAPSIGREVGALRRYRWLVRLRVWWSGRR